MEYVMNNVGVWVPRYVDVGFSVRTTTALMRRVMEGLTPFQRASFCARLEKRSDDFRSWLKAFLFGDQRGMAGSWNNFWEDEILDNYIGNAAYATPATFHFYASTTDPTDAGSSKTEPSGNNYSRVAVTNNATNFPAASGGTKSNGTAILYPEASGSWGSISHLGAISASSGGDHFFYGDITGGAVAVGASQVLRIPIGDLDFTLS